MANFKRLISAAAALVICLSLVFAAGAAENGELRITTKTVGTYELEIKLENICDYYLGNVKIKIEGSGDSVEIESYGLADGSGDTVRELAPGETVTLTAKIDPASIKTEAPITTPPPVKNPSNTTTATTTTKAPVNNTTTRTPAPNTPAQTTTNNPLAVITPSQGDPDTVTEADPVTEAVTGDAAGTDETATVTDETGTDTASDSDTSEETTVHTIHEIAPGESVTIYATLAGGTEDEPATIMPAKKIPDYTIWVGLAVVLVLAAAVAVIFIIKKKNGGDDGNTPDGDGGADNGADGDPSDGDGDEPVDNDSTDSDDSDTATDTDSDSDTGAVTKTVTSILVFALILTGTASFSADAAETGTGTAAVDAAATELKEATPGNMTETVTLSGGKGSIVVTADYTIVPHAKVEDLKSARRVPSGDECDTPQVNERRLVEGSGPLTSHGIYIGEKDFMFYGAALDDYTGKSVMNDARINKLVNMMNDRDEWAKENGIKLYMVIAPNKTSVYSDYVPDSVKAADVTNTDKVVEALKASSTVEVIDLRQPLIDARATYGDTLFYKYDTHWNNNGGFVGYTEVMKHVNQDIQGAITLNRSDFDITEKETYMKDMAYYLGFYSRYTDYGPVYTLKSGMTATIGAKQHDGFWGQFRFCSRWSDGYSDALQYVTYENKYNETAPDVYMYRDSFSVSMIHFIKDSFHNSVFDWSYDFNKQEILKSGAEVVIMEVVEKQLYEFNNSRTFSAN